VKVGITLPQIGEHATKENIINLSKKAEKQGFDSLWVLERLVLPLKPSNSERSSLYFIYAIPQVSFNGYINLMLKKFRERRDSKFLNFIARSETHVVIRKD
jgi:alkanesulfonate monooxygenase SsuD/methylene tetrahydromethanopterin reductase-like flavin-dependent oxidoreductase (luciferase family)